MLVAATYDVLAGARDMRTAADRLERRDVRRAPRQPLRPDGAARGRARPPAGLPVRHQPAGHRLGGRGLRCPPRGRTPVDASRGGSMHRTSRRLRTGAAGASAWRLARGRAAALPGASGAVAASRGPKVVEVTTDTPLAELPSRASPATRAPRSTPAPTGAAARRHPHHADRVGRLAHHRLPDQGRLRRHQGRLRRLAVRRPARRGGTARPVGPRGRRGRAAGRRPRTCARR